MKPITSATMAAAVAALGTALAFGPASPASASPAAAGSGVANQIVHGKVPVEFARWRGRRGWGPGYRRYGYYGRPYYYRRHRGAAVGAGIAGLAAGALIGGALAAQAQPAPAYMGSADAYCSQRFKSYDPASGTYLGYDGDRHPCP